MSTARATQATAVPAPRPAARPGRPRLRLAEVAAERRSAAGVLGKVLLGLLFVAVFGVVVLQALLVQTQSRLDDLDGRIAAEHERADDLRLQLAELRSPARIVGEARDRLGMIQPEEVIYLQNDPEDDAAARLEPSPDEGTATP